MRIQTKRISKKTYLTVLSTILVLVTMIGTSFGFLMKVNETDTTYATGVLSVELVTNEEGYGETINLNNTVPMTDAEGMSLSPYKFKITNTGSLDYQFDLKLVLDEEKMTQDGCANNTLSFSNVKIQVNDESPVLLDSLTDSILISDSILKAGKSQEVSIRIWLDENTTNDAIGKHFHAKLATDGYAIETEIMKETFADQLANLYTSTSKTIVTNNEIEYHYATSVSLMNDRLGGTTKDYDAGNIRYYGASPDNYIYFNCDDYSNQTADTCELWRIIGVFGDKVKIIRNESIGDFSWDNKDTTTGAEEEYGKNDWTTARLMKLLNPSYYYTIDPNDNDLGQSLYYNSGSGTCYSGKNNATTSCDFTSTGLKNDTTRNMIAEVSWNLGGWSTTEIYSNQIYSYERGTTVYSGRPTSWSGKIALMYPSDYGYATDFTKCSQYLRDYNDVLDDDSVTDLYLCRTNDWLFNSTTQWLLTPNSGNSYRAWSVDSTGSVLTSKSGTSATCGIRPVLYLNTELVIGSGTGSSSAPYRLNVS